MSLDSFRVNGATSDSLTPNTASEVRYASPAANTCVVRRLYPCAATLKWMCAGRMGWRPMAVSSSPTGPSTGTG